MEKFIIWQGGTSTSGQQNILNSWKIAKCKNNFKGHKLILGMLGSQNHLFLLGQHSRFHYLQIKFSPEHNNILTVNLGPNTNFRAKITLQRTIELQISLKEFQAKIFEEKISKHSILYNFFLSSKSINRGEWCTFGVLHCNLEQGIFYTKNNTKALKNIRVQLQYL